MQHAEMHVALQVHDETGKMEYTGEIVDLTEAISRLPAGCILTAMRMCTIDVVKCSSSQRFPVIQFRLRPMQDSYVLLIIHCTHTHMMLLTCQELLHHHVSCQGYDSESNH